MTAKNISLDIEDQLRLENVNLKEQIATMSAKIAVAERNMLQNYLVSKYDIDTDVYSLQINMNQKIITLVPLR